MRGGGEVLMRVIDDVLSELIMEGMGNRGMRVGFGNV